MNIEYEVKVVPIDAEHANKVKQLHEEGWELMPGVVPVGVYHVIRNAAKPKVQASAGFGTLIIDDSKVTVVGPDGKPKQ